MICEEPYPRGVDSFRFAMSCSGSEHTVQECGGVTVVGNCPRCVEGGWLRCQPGMAHPIIQTAYICILVEANFLDAQQSYNVYINIVCKM